MPVRFFHTADLHLGRPFPDIQNLSAEQKEHLAAASSHALIRMVDDAIEEDIDFILIAGDLYDIEDRPIAPQLFFNQQMERLNQVGIPVYLIHGNHDSLAQADAYLQAPSNVHVFPKGQSTFVHQTGEGERYAISGYSYPNRWVEEAVLKDFPSRNTQVDFHIGMHHGSLVTGEKADPYGPFSIQDIHHLNYDYLALGHFHKGQQVSAQPPAYYSGSLQGLSRKEQGPKGYLDVLIRQGQAADVIFIPCQEVIWQTVTIDLTQSTTLNQAIEASQQAIWQLENLGVAYLLSLDFIHVGLAYEVADLVQVLEENLNQNLAIIVSYSSSYIPETSELPQEWQEALRQAADLLDDDLWKILQEENPGIVQLTSGLDQDVIQEAIREISERWS